MKIKDIMDWSLVIGIVSQGFALMLWGIGRII